MSKFLNSTITVFYLSVIVFSALAHGAVEAWSQAISSVGIIIVLMLWVLKACLEKQWTIRIPAPVWPLLAFIVLGLSQSLTWTTERGQRGSLSLDVEATRAAVLWMVLLGLAFLIAANIFTSRERITLLSTFFVAFGLALALFALLQQATWNGHFYWWRAIDAEKITSPFGPFVHHGHFAGYLEMLLPIPIAFLFVHQIRLEKKLLYGFAAMIMGVSVVASLARGGMLSLAVQLIFLTTTGFWMTRLRNENAPQSVTSRASMKTVIAICGAILIGVLWIGTDTILNRIVEPENSATPITQNFVIERGWIWRDTFTMFRANPFIGVGFGAFETAFPIYGHGDGSLMVNAAHNDYLQLLAEGGLLGAGLMMWFVIAVMRILLASLRSHDSRIQALALGSATGMIGILVHSCFDFNLQLPSHSLLFLTIVAAMTGLKASETKCTVSAVGTSKPQPAYFEMAERLSERS